MLNLLVGNMAAGSESLVCVFCDSKFCHSFYYSNN